MRFSRKVLLNNGRRRIAWGDADDDRGTRKPVFLTFRMVRQVRSPCDLHVISIQCDLHVISMWSPRGLHVISM